MKISFGDIYITQFDPSFGREYKKIRPAVIIRNAEISDASPLVTVLPISSRLERRTPHDIFIEKDHKNHLASDSVVKVHQISTFDKQRLLKHIGAAGSPVLRQVRGYLRRHFGL